MAQNMLVRPDLALNGSVGAGGANAQADVLTVSTRLKELGYLKTSRTTVDEEMLDSIRLFQSIIAGVFVVGGDGRVDVNGPTHKFLRASNAPRWQSMPVNARGYHNFDRGDQGGNHDFGTDWLAQTLLAAADSYDNNYRSSHPGSALLVTNDLSLPHGGDTPSHEGHETGLEADILLPHKNGDFGAITWQDAAFDRDATIAIMKALRDQPLFLLLFFNDPALIEAGFCHHAEGHDNHVHVRIRPQTANR